jgi:hypothetical protein
LQRFRGIRQASFYLPILQDKNGQYVKGPVTNPYGFSLPFNIKNPQVSPVRRKVTACTVTSARTLRLSYVIWFSIPYDLGVDIAVFLYIQHAVRYVKFLLQYSFL